MRIWLLGFPLDTVTDEEAEKKALDLADKFKKDHIPQYVATVNINFLAHSWSYFGIKNCEFLACLREASLIVADSEPLVLISSMLGCPLPMKVTSQKLFPELVETFTLAAKSIFLLGGSQELLNKCEIEILSHYPTANIVGALTPSIYIEGSKIRDSLERDRLILDVIHKAHPDLLFIQLGAPKQELWFHRVKNELKVPLSMGLGSTFERYTKLQTRNGTSLIKKAFRSLSRYINDALKLVWFGVPLIVYYNFNKLISFYSHINTCPNLCQKPSLLFLSPLKTISVIRLPCLIDKERAEMLANEMTSHLEHDVIIVDFQAVRHVDLYGCAYLVELWEKAKKHKNSIYGLYLRGDVRWILILNKLWDIVGSDQVKTAYEALNRMGEKESLFMAVEQDWAGVQLYFFGALSSTPDYEKLLEQIYPLIENKALTVNLNYMSHSESRGEWFLIKIKEHQEAIGRGFKILRRPT